MTALLASCLRSRRAAGGAEFALILPVLIALLFGVIDVGRFMWQLNQAEKATQVGARMAIVTTPVSPGLVAHNFASGSIPAGSTIPASALTGLACTSATCTCEGTCPIANLAVDGVRISNDEAVGAAIHLCMAGRDTVASLLVFVLAYLARHPGERQLLLSDPTRLQGAATEFTRRFPIVVMSRRVRQDMEFEGTQLKRDDMVTAATMSYNLDPEIFPDPLRFDPSRRTVQLATFGHGIHRCPGAILGRMELVITLQEWLKRIPDFEIVDETVLRTNGGIVASMPALNLRWRV